MNVIVSSFEQAYLQDRAADAAERMSAEDAAHLAELEAQDAKATELTAWPVWTAAPEVLAF